MTMEQDKKNMTDDSGAGKKSRRRAVRKAESREMDSSSREEYTEQYKKKDAKGRRGGFRSVLILLAFCLAFAGGVGTGWYRWGRVKPYKVDLKAIEIPDWITQDFIRKNIFSRPNVSLKRVNSIVIHYVANPGSSAKANRDYFDGLADQDPQGDGTSSSSHFVVGLEGEVIQCIPLSEIAYASGPRNSDTIAIESCHPDESGKFNDNTYASLVRLTAWLCGELDLTEKDLIRHYDVSQKICPKYFVDHEEAWEQFKRDVKAQMSAGN